MNEEEVFVHHIKCSVCGGDLELETYGTAGSPGFPVCENCFPSWEKNGFKGVNA